MHFLNAIEGMGYESKRCQFAIRDKGTRAVRHRLVPISSNRPRFCFISGLAIDRLPTLERIGRWSAADVTLPCLFCKYCSETRSHFFFECRFSAQVWCNVMEICSADRIPGKLAS